MTIELVLMSAAIGTVVACLIFIGFQVWETKERQAQAEEAELLDRMVELAEQHNEGETLADTAIRVARQRKDAQRRARQRKAKRRQK